MIVPFDKRAPAPAQTEEPTEAQLLMALAQLHGEGRLAGLTQQDQPMLEQSTRTARGVNTGREGAQREMDLKRPPLDVDKIMRPGSWMPDRRLGPPGGRDVRGI